MIDIKSVWTIVMKDMSRSSKCEHILITELLPLDGQESLYSWNSLNFKEVSKLRLNSIMHSLASDYNLIYFTNDHLTASYSVTYRFRNGLYFWDLGVQESSFTKKDSNSRIFHRVIFFPFYGLLDIMWYVLHIELKI